MSTILRLRSGIAWQQLLHRVSRVAQRPPTATFAVPAGAVNGAGCWRRQGSAPGSRPRHRRCASTSGTASGTSSLSEPDAAPSTDNFDVSQFEELVTAGKRPAALAYAQRFVDASIIQPRDARFDACASLAALLCTESNAVPEAALARAESLVSEAAALGHARAQFVQGMVAQLRADQAEATAARAHLPRIDLLMSVSAVARTIVAELEALRGEAVNVKELVRRQNQRHQQPDTDGDVETPEQSHIRQLQRQAYDWFQKAVAAANLREAKTALGLCYLGGVGCEAADPETAERLFREAADAGEPDAHYNLGLLYSYRPTPDLRKAYHHMRHAAELGNAAAEFFLGHAYLAGDICIKPDTAESMRFLLRSAARGHPAAHYFLARIYCGDYVQFMYDGPVQADRAKFRRHLEAAVRAEHPEAMRFLAECIYKGEHGYGKDYHRALHLFFRAAQHHLQQREHHESGDALCSAAA
eukprot:ctg_1143.g411